MASYNDRTDATETNHGVINTIATDDGEINVYRDADGYHAERWSESRRMIVSQSGDCETAAEAIERVE